MGMFDKFKRDMRKNRGKATVLGVLFVGMVGMSVRAFFQLQPQAADGAVIPSAVDAADKTLAGSAASFEGRKKDSEQMWHHLRDVSPTALAIESTFAFDKSAYPELPDLNRPTAVVKVASTQSASSQPTNTMAENAAARAKETKRIKDIVEEARTKLSVKGTIVSGGGTEPVTLVNQKYLRVGEVVNEFEIIAIRENEVEFQKEGVTVIVTMSDRPNKP